MHSTLYRLGFKSGQQNPPMTLSLAGGINRQRQQFHLTSDLSSQGEASIAMVQEYALGDQQGGEFVSGPGTRRFKAQGMKGGECTGGHSWVMEG